jgi:hypothetical protein
MTPPVEIAEKIPCQPYGLKPPAAWKFAPWKTVTMSATIAIAGIAIFHTVIALFDFASFATPRMFTTVKTSISTAATA